MISFLILDYERPQELVLCAQSVRQNAKFEHRTTVLVNGGDSKAAEMLIKRGVIDSLIINPKNTGGGYGTTQLIKSCYTEYAFYVQEDQCLAREFTQENLDEMLFSLDYNYSDIIGLAGDHCNGNYSERAQLIDVEWYNKQMVDAPNGGPGPFHHVMHNEEYLQRRFKHESFIFKIWKPAYFADNGKRSIREYPCGGKTIHFTDTKELFVIVPPKQKYVFPNLTDDEWDTVIQGKWQDGRIPEKDKPHSFIYWQ